ncbi:MAG: serine/threonine-protein kinase, partial [Acidobacteriota bacterium]
MIGRTISHYRIVEKIGEGGMGEVYLAEDTSLPRKMALKFLPAAFADDELAHKRFLREARSAAALDHPYICDVFEVASTDDGTDFIVMEYVEGETLQARLERGPLSLKETLKLGTELAEALESAHAKGIIHRDLKPSNIMLTPAGHAKVMDFGLAKRLMAEGADTQDLSSALTGTGAVLGTLPYMSPEHIRGQAVDHRSDIFSLGIVLYEALTGVHPFRKAQPGETAGAILKEEAPPLSRYVAEVPELLRHTVEKMLAKDPTERFQSVHEVLTNLNRLREDSGKVTMIQDERVLRMPTWAWLAAMVAVCAIVLIAWEFWLRPEGPNTSVPLMRSSIVLPEGERLASGINFRHAVAISPDGRWVAYASYKQAVRDEPEVDSVINLRRLDQTEVRRISGLNPFFS